MVSEAVSSSEEPHTPVPLIAPDMRATSTSSPRIKQGLRLVGMAETGHVVPDLFEVLVVVAACAGGIADDARI